MRVEQLDLNAWGDALPSSGFEVFHTPAALSVLDEHASGQLRLYGGFKGEQPIALLPVVLRQQSVGTAMLSPPPAMGVPRLGPVIMSPSPKRRKQERVNREFTKEVLEELEIDSSLSLLRMVCNTAYDDPRPYVWNDLSVEPFFTYTLQLDGANPDDLLSSFSKSLRREIRDAKDIDVVVERVPPLEGARLVYEDAKSRYEEQDEQYRLSWPYVRDLVGALADERRCRVYLARTPDGEYLSGITALYSNDMAYFWQGGTRATYDGTSINSLLHWRIIEDIIDDPPIDSVHAYDLMGANTERLCRYKAKFGAELVPYYLVESTGRSMDVAKRAYSLISH
ncbi:GNAT family N-acetyltransferase [Halegenticoccus tardaugens]|uniref:GNAT family N-acetyltransferase n=1 Tax=Halegenticoccus tardaugens TaxID=2071624 RepID=UPI00100C28FB|nr:GNAT family N-acetyltransferase [Halegenticoccus tardaugens]